MAINWNNVERKQTVPEEKVSSILHIVGAGLAFVGFIILIVLGIQHRNPIHFLAFFLYGFGMCFLYCMSSIYHGIQRPGIKKVFERLDYASIFIMIAGSYSPISLIVLQGHPLLSWGLFAGVWTLAVLCSIVTLLFVRQIGIINILVYAVMGMMSLALIPTVYRIMGIWIILSAAFGGLLYIIGLPFFVARFRYHHAVWHSLVLAGSFVHFVTIVIFLYK